MMKPRGLTIERLRSVLAYDPLTGVFTWVAGSSCNRRIGKRAGTCRGDGRRLITIDGRRYYASNLAWALVHGAFPPRLVDHENRQRDDDRLENLRLATVAENNQNSCGHRDSLSGLKGVSLEKRTGRWRARIYRHGREVALGTFPDKNAAHSAYVAAGGQA